MNEKIAYVDKVKIISLIDNSPRYDTYLKGSFGVSFWVEVQSGNKRKVILFDVGPLAEPFIYNAKMLGLNLADVDMIVLSHCHFDHTAALSEVISEIGHYL
jgi:7,8-dihydropterin-6-yl-methyl-4-(beta-D-ribofuranosyl)aminobenzene 5'-phosphate synthase